MESCAEMDIGCICQFGENKFDGMKNSVLEYDMKMV